ncbi:MAG: hypoxanthine-guanine phosphoribosyltransferase [Methylobacter tundripaludum]|nr:hypoxanthine-guanine phosphoribosyltransferase [Methylobacter tundripaludum]
MLEEINRVRETADLLHSEQEVEAAIEKIAQEINIAFADRNPLVLCVINGGIVAAGKLLPRLTIPLTLDSIHASRYQNQTSGGSVKWLVQPETPLKDRTVLIVDDILDEGITLEAIYDYCREQGATAIYSAVLVDKILDHQKTVTADFIGLRVVNRYLFGYGMDYKGYLRNAPGIYACKE